MLVADSSQSQIRVFKEGTLVPLEMEECKEQARRPSKVHDVEEGEISDSASSVEEITEEDFKNKPEPSPAVLSSTADLRLSPHPQPKNSNVNPEISNNSSNNQNSNNNNYNNNNQKQRVWTMRDLYKYQISRNYSAGLYNLAWASAVQNKPLDEVLVMEFPKTTSDSDAPANLKRVGSEGSPKIKNNGNAGGGGGGGEKKDAFAVGANENVVIQVDDEGKAGGGGEGEGEGEEKEEGELEEGEIDVDSETVDGSGNFSKEDGDLSSLVGEDAVLEKRIDSIIKELENVNVQEAEKSFGEVCFRVQNLLDNLQDIAKENSLTKKDDLVQLSFSVIQTLNSVFYSMNQNQQEQMKESMKRLLSDITSQKHPLFSAEQFKQMEFMVSSLDSFIVASDFKASDCSKGMQVVKGFAGNDTGISSGIDSTPEKSSDQTDPWTSLENLKFGAANSKYRGLTLPLLDLHKDHDVDSLPSPTREAPSCLPIGKGFGMGHGVLKPEWPIPRVILKTDNVSVHPYETDAVKAVSTYQQKFGRSSFVMNDRLPSPTPSEDGNTGDGDMSEEVSSSPNRLVIPVNTTLVGQSMVSSTTKMENISGQGPSSVWNASTLGSGRNPQLKPSSAKSRDPRLRLANSDAATWDRLLSNEPKVEPVGGMISSRKQKTVEEPALDGPALKRQRNNLTDSGTLYDAQAVSGTGGWLEDTGNVGLLVTARKPELQNDPRMRVEAETGVNSSSTLPNITVKVNENLPVASPSATNSFQSLLKDLAVNPSMLMGIIKMGQQKSTGPTKSTSQPTSLNATLGPVPLTNLAAPKTSLKTTSVEEPGTIRMKPRDPRRVLHSNTLQRGGSTELDQSQAKTSTLRTSGLIDNLNDQTPEEELDRNPVPSPLTPPDITRLFTKNLKNIADLMSVSQAISSTSVLPQIPSSQAISSISVLPRVPSSQPAQAVEGRIDSKGISELGCLQAGTVMVGKELPTGTTEPRNNWGDVEHLFEGFDDQQKVAIQRERSRRIEEQRKMFAARKLCLVLDLDHTLLNSAKFVEVDPVHDEILRKKEEQDREKPHRHLFRFPHMGMWTKLRPGIWNFLEKASKLYELHLYTMGNKIYATEMAKLLDPKGNLFAGRVISRGDDGDLLDGDERVPKSKDLEGVLGMESAVVIIDDSVRVWPHNKLNLIVVERYIYFPCSRRQFGLLGPSLLEIDHDERPEDGTLASSLAVIERIHHIFFVHQSLDEADVRNILASEQRKILAGCRVVFSRVFPVGEANPHLHPLWQTAEQFGAVCTNSIDEQVTHVVANSPGTDKVNWALSTGRFVVHPGWVEASALLYRRANEHDFAIKP